MTPILGIMASQISGHLTPPSSFESIASATGTGSSATITFGSIPGTYKSLQIRINATTASAQGTNALYFNTDNAGSSYGRHRLQGNGTSALAAGFIGNSTMSWDRYGSFTTYPTVTIIDIIDYASTTKNKTVKFFCGQNDNTTATNTSNIELSSGLWTSIAAVTDITIENSFNWTTASTFALYGVN